MNHVHAQDNVDSGKVSKDIVQQVQERIVSTGDNNNQEKVVNTMLNCEFKDKINDRDIAKGGDREKEMKLDSIHFDSTVDIEGSNKCNESEGQHVKQTPEENKDKRDNNNSSNSK